MGYKGKYNEAFFTEHAAFSYDPSTETEEDGKKRAGAALAKAYAALKESDYTIRWENEDLEPDYDDEDLNEKIRSGELLWKYCALIDPDGELVESLGCITLTTMDDPYVKVVEAELFEQHMNDPEQK